MKLLLALVLAALLFGGAAPPAQVEVKLDFPANYRERFVRYGVVDRPDGTVRYLYASPDAARGVKASGTLPIGATLVIETFSAKKNAGRLVRTSHGHLVPHELVRRLDVMRKRADKHPSENFSFENWLSGRFDPVTRRRLDDNVAECWICHQSVSGRDFVFSKKALIRSLLSGRVVRRDCDKPGRQLCADDFEQIVTRRP